MYLQAVSLLVLASLVSSTLFTPFMVSEGLVRRQSCSSLGELTCGDNCMPSGAACCTDGSSTYCPSGEYCVSGGCCPDGESCSGPSPGTKTSTIDVATATGASSPSKTTSRSAASATSTSSSAGTCGILQTTCGTGCMPSTGTCCPASSGYCSLGEYCISGGCCEIGKTCTGSSGSSSSASSPLHSQHIWMSPICSCILGSLVAFYMYAVA